MQAQAEGLVSEIHIKEMELEKLNGLWKAANSNVEMNIARNRFGRTASDKGFTSSDYVTDSNQKGPYYTGTRSERLMLLRSAFVVYILALHIVVFIKISF